MILRCYSKVEVALMFLYSFPTRESESIWSTIKNSLSHEEYTHLQDQVKSWYSTDALENIDDEKRSGKSTR
jgi:hypothetical protein